MKTLITLLAISLCLFSCKKDEEMKPQNKVEYKISCDECYIEIGEHPVKITKDVKGFYIFSEVDNSNETNILVYSKGSVTTQVKLNDKIIFNQTDSNDYFIYNVKLK